MENKILTRVPGLHQNHTQKENCETVVLNRDSRRAMYGAIPELLLSFKGGTYFLRPPGLGAPPLRPARGASQRQ
jgi:hypothetical protein